MLIVADDRLESRRERFCMKESNQDEEE